MGGVLELEEFASEIAQRDVKRRPWGKTARNGPWEDRVVVCYIRGVGYCCVVVAVGVVGVSRGGELAGLKGVVLRKGDAVRSELAEYAGSSWILGLWQRCRGMDCRGMDGVLCSCGCWGSPACGERELLNQPLWSKGCHIATHILSPGPVCRCIPE